MPITPNQNQKKMQLLPRLLGLSFLLFYLWDFYLQGVGLRMFEIPALTLIAFGIVVTSMFPNLSAGFAWRKISLIYLLFGLSLVLMLLGVCNDIDNLKAGVGFLLGVLIFAIYYSARLKQEDAIKIVNIIIIIGALYLIAQFLLFNCCGYVLNLQKFLGAENRGVTRGRPTGLFLEPAGYAIVTMMLLVLRMRLRRSFDFIVYLALASTFLSLSLWGFISSVVFLAVYKRNNLIFWLILAVAVGVFVRYANFENTLFKSRIIDRIETIAKMQDGDASNEDVSSMTRYSGEKEITEKIEPIQYFLGKGISNWNLFYGYNGLSFLLSAGGYLGTTLIFILFFGLMSFRTPLEMFIMILLCMTGAPLWTYLYWWAWLGLLLRAYEPCEPAKTCAAGTV